MLPCYRMKTHITAGRISRIAVLAVLCLLVMSPSSSARSRHKLEVTLPGAEGHPNGTLMMASVRVGNYRIDVTRLPLFGWSMINVSAVKQATLRQPSRPTAKLSCPNDR